MSKNEIADAIQTIGTLEWSRKFQKDMRERQNREEQERKLFCSICGRKGTVAKCCYSSWGINCIKYLCEDCAKKCKKCGKYFCSEHINNHKCR